MKVYLATRVNKRKSAKEGHGHDLLAYKARGMVVVVGGTEGVCDFVVEFTPQDLEYITGQLEFNEEMESKLDALYREYEN